MKWKILSKLGACLEVKCLFDLFEEWGRRPFGTPERYPLHLMVPFFSEELPEVVDLRISEELPHRWFATPPKPAMEGQVWREPHYEDDFCVIAYRERLAVRGEDGALRWAVRNPTLFF